MTDEQFKQFMDKLERIEALLRGVGPQALYLDRIPQYLWTEGERAIIEQLQSFENRRTP